ncbi:hypothetical protein Z043_124042 [Scleropages formosus]|uniref:Teneurin N-terminal domain-containing protein n=1 Tax=Scleropages formosus TaxID=113540 RepID=A0A0P7UCU4_SCLFO|nr:hypothetical protein Z043_124042 [Scleropages formosus]
MREACGSHAGVTRESRSHPSCVSAHPAYVELAPIGISYIISGVQYTGNFTLAELGVRDATARSAPYQADAGPAPRGYSPSVASDADSDVDAEEAVSPERAVQLWSSRDTKSRRSSGLSSQENSVLTLTDSDNDGKSDNESGCDVARNLFDMNPFCIWLGCIWLYF